MEFSRNRNKTRWQCFSLLHWLGLLLAGTPLSVTGAGYVMTAAEAGMSTQLDGPQAPVVGVQFNAATLNQQITQRLEAALRGGVSSKELAAQATEPVEDQIAKRLAEMFLGRLVATNGFVYGTSNTHLFSAKHLVFGISAKAAQPTEDRPTLGIAIEVKLALPTTERWDLGKPRQRNGGEDGALFDVDEVSKLNRFEWYPDGVLACGTINADARPRSEKVAQVFGPGWSVHYKTNIVTDPLKRQFFPERPFGASPLREKVALMNKAERRRHLESLVAKGPPDARFLLGREMFLHGQNSERERALALLKSAADAGLRDAASEYGKALCFGLNDLSVTTDEATTALAYLRQAAEQDDIEARSLLLLLQLRREGQWDQPGSFDSTPVRRSELMNEMEALAKELPDSPAIRVALGKCLAWVADYNKGSPLIWNSGGVESASDVFESGRWRLAANAYSHFEAASSLGCLEALLLAARAKASGYGTKLNEANAVTLYEKLKIGVLWNSRRGLISEREAAALTDEIENAIREINQPAAIRYAKLREQLPTNVTTNEFRGDQVDKSTPSVPESPVLRSDSPSPSSLEDRAAISAAGKFAGLIDDGLSWKVWPQAAPAFQKKTSKNRWLDQIVDTAGGLGEARSRELHSFKAAPVPKGFPDGDYRVVEFQSKYEYFENFKWVPRPIMIEQILLFRDKNGEWKFCGYSIR